MAVPALPHVLEIMIAPPKERAPFDFETKSRERDALVAEAESVGEPTRSDLLAEAAHLSVRIEAERAKALRQKKRRRPPVYHPRLIAHCDDHGLWLMFAGHLWVPEPGAHYSFGLDADQAKQVLEALARARMPTGAAP